MVINKFKRKVQGFTLLEILCVIAIIGILTSILLPAISLVRKTALKAETKMRFHQYIFALESYFREYGHYPAFFDDKPCINLKEEGHQFIQALSGSESYCDLNPGNICFYQFTNAEINAEGQLKDGFNNTNIYVHIDTENKGLLTIEGKKIANKIAIYTKKSDGKEYEDIQSWE